MGRALKIGVWFAIAAVVGLSGVGRSGDAGAAPPAAKLTRAASR